MGGILLCCCAMYIELERARAAGCIWISGEISRLCGSCGYIVRGAALGR